MNYDEAQDSLMSVEHATHEYITALYSMYKKDLISFEYYLSIKENLIQSNRLLSHRIDLKFTD
jgi:hypothetical protein